MLLRLFALSLAFAVAAPSAAAQPATAESVPAAEAAFQNGIASYGAGEYAEAERLFTRAADEFGFNERTTAATLMAAKAAYADGDFDRAIAAATRLVAQYPGSRYAEPARTVLANATTGGRGGRGRPLDLGVVLPIAGEGGYFGQALFNGIRIAVDERNASGTGRPVRMVFRDSRATGAGARAAVEAVVAEGVDLVVGPLTSEEAGPAGEAAEAARVVLVAPLATDGAVSAGKRFVFQANPTFAERGRAMARYATGRLGLNRLGVAAQRETLGADMAGAFAAEARRLGARVDFETLIDAADDWQDLDREVGEARLRAVDAVYLPVTGRDAPRYADDALRALDAIGRAPRPLGNTEWEGLQASKARASRLGAVFTQDFFVAPGAADAFGRRYRELAGIGQDRLALIGYDITRLVLREAEADEGALADALRAAPMFEGLGHRFHFDGGQVNEALYILGFRDGQAVLLE
ncbi:ABC transporter substrate-binding protein [Rubrivirga sp. IMCC45206]|uniref:ABC transporter substrate-binding protein n=1 Tax=Rubrivirga sp. IMCC45206 TaxID=3391614 RepID=UPI00398FB1A3